MKYIQKFADHSNFRNKKAAYNNLVALCDLESHIHYGQDSDYANECFSIKILSGEDATIELHYDSSGNGINSIHMARVPVNCDSKTGEIYYEGINSQPIDGQNGIIVINQLNTGDQIWLYTADHMFMPWVEEETGLQHGAIEFNMTGCTVSLQGNLMSLFDDDGVSMPVEDTILGDDGEGNIDPIYDYLFYNMFHFGDSTTTIGDDTFTGNEVIIYAHNLVFPLKKMPNYACYQMFRGCFALKTCPQLYATSMGRGCYYSMYYTCISLEDISYLNLSDVTVSRDGYREMFMRCINLKKIISRLDIKQSNSTSIGEGAEYYNCHQMFRECAITETPEIYCNSSTGYCGFSYMFYNCKKLVKINPITIVNSLRKRGFYFMFGYCTSLVDISNTVIRLSTSTSNSFHNQHNMRNMFEACSNLEIGPKIITKDGKLRAPGSGSGYTCYRMFLGCSKLRYVDFGLITETLPSNVTTDWMNNVQTTSGIFITVDESLWNGGTRGGDGIPSNWTVKDPNGNIL